MLAEAGFFAGGGETGALVRRHDWACTALGPIEDWSQSLKTVVSMLLLSPVPIVLLWGEDGVMLYNDAYSTFAGERHPQLLGSKVREGWPEAADFNDHVMKVGLAGGTLSYKDQELTLHRHGRPEQVWMNLDYSPVLNENNRPAGVIAILVETTARVLAERRAACEIERQRRLFQRAPGFICAMRGPDHVVEFVNDAYRRLVGDRSLVGKPVRECFPDLEGQHFFELLDRVFASGERFVAQAYPAQLRRASDAPQEDVLLDFIYEPVTDESGRVVGIFCEGFDVTEAHRAQAALREQQELLEQLIDTLPALVAFIDREGRYRLLNRTYEDWFGRPRGEIIGKHMREVLGEEAFALRKVQFEAVLRGERQTFEAFTPRPDGTRRDTELEYLPRRASDGRVTGFFVLVTDVTERRRIERALVVSERRMHAVLEAVSEAFYALDAEWRFTLFNRAAEEFFGLTRAEVLGRKLWDVTPLTMGSEIERCLRQVMETRTPAQYEGYSVRHPDRYVTMRIAPKRGGGLAASLTDTTARRRAEEALQRLNETLEARVEERTRERNQVWTMSRDLLAVMGFDGRLKAINPAWVNTLGFDEATLLARDLCQQVHPDDHVAVEAAVERLRQGETITRLEDRLRHADGSWRWIAWALVPGDDVFYGVGRDITAEKEAAAALEQAQAALRQSQKMEVVGQLTGGIAHDFNNLLGAIVGGFDLIQRKPDDPAKVRRWAEHGLEAAERGAKLTGQLLAFSRTQRIELKPVIVSNLVEGMGEMLARTLGPMIQISLNSDIGNVAVRSDPTQLEMAILNLAV
jgi:PAS domain S-box-containing protein